VCDTNTEASTVFSNATLAAGVPIALTIPGVSGSPVTVNIHIEGTFDPQ
jgi:hypothetical protein